LASLLSSYDAVATLVGALTTMPEKVWTVSRKSRTEEARVRSEESLGVVNKEFVLFNLREAKEEIERTLLTLKATMNTIWFSFG
jgi:hypothetical protein